MHPLRSPKKTSNTKEKDRWMTQVLKKQTRTALLTAMHSARIATRRDAHINDEQQMPASTPLTPEPYQQPGSRICNKQVRRKRRRPETWAACFLGALPFRNSNQHHAQIIDSQTGDRKLRGGGGGLRPYLLWPSKCSCSEIRSNTREYKERVPSVSLSSSSLLRVALPPITWRP